MLSYCCMRAHLHFTCPFHLPRRFLAASRNRYNSTHPWTTPAQGDITHQWALPFEDKFEAEGSKGHSACQSSLRCKIPRRANCMCDRRIFGLSTHHILYIVCHASQEAPRRLPLSRNDQKRVGYNIYVYICI